MNLNVKPTKNQSTNMRSCWFNGAWDGERGLIPISYNPKSYNHQILGIKKAPAKAGAFYGKSIKYYSETTSTAIVTTTSLCKLTIAS